ncbi:hypothetical protein FAGAP_4904 [Fusarium agapanthi]|uniref:Chromo domain-containing protein n=1 Tax=Fusarium agapanthi TaxID=1803897 RepID=A0A9P5E7L9_9HYPO|nr:hypothetical protein FAGAP_4904 [Fusarium agapanthi]
MASIETTSQSKRLMVYFRLLQHWSMVSHRVNHRSKTVEFLVQWIDSPRSWELEEFLPQIGHETVYNYWKDRGGRDEVTGLEEHHVFKVKSKGWKKGEWSYNCQWVGYPPEQNTWEPEAKIMDIAPAAVEDLEAREAVRKAKSAARKAVEKAASQQEADEDTEVANH